MVKTSTLLRLRRWMSANGETFDSLARRCPTRPTPESLRQIVCGYRRPSSSLAFALEEIVGGGITAKKLLDPNLYRRGTRHLSPPRPRARRSLARSKGGRC